MARQEKTAQVQVSQGGWRKVKVMGVHFLAGDTVLGISVNYREALGSDCQGAGKQSWWAEGKGIKGLGGAWSVCMRERSEGGGHSGLGGAPGC